MICVYCKGPHKHTICPLYLKALKATSKVKIGTSFSGEAPAPFIGHSNYPNLGVGMLSVPNTSNTSNYDDPLRWSRENYTIPDVVELRRSLINARRKLNVFSRAKYITQVQEIALASKPVDVEVDLKRRPFSSFTFSDNAAPYGPRAEVTKSTITSNPKIHTKVDKVFSDIDRTAVSGLQYLHKAGFSEHFLSQILSVGTLGVKKDRKLVPTKWSITATDDILCKQILEKVKELSFHDCMLFEGNYMGNYYFFILAPVAFSYELFELYGPAYAKGKEQYSTDYESYFGRKEYAKECVGGYYSVRLAIAQYLQRAKRQASVFALRIITEEYTTPLGVWVTREASRKAFDSKPLEFSTTDLAITYLTHKISTKFGINIQNIIKKSKLLASMQQTRLSKWTR